MRYYISVLLPQEINARLEEIKRKWAGENTSPPHLTLVPPRWLAPDRSENELLQVLAENLPEVAAFPVVMTRVGYFGRRANVHIKIERTAALVACHETIERAVRGILLPVEGNFGHLRNPHISLARGDEAWKTLENENFADCFLCRTIHLWGKEREGACWRQTGVFRLGRSANSRPST